MKKFKIKYVVKTLEVLVITYVVIFICFEVMIIKGYKDIEKEKVRRADVLIVLGCSLYGKTPSPLLEKRLESAIKLYKKKLVKDIIVSGGQGNGEKTTEAQGMRNYLISKGIAKNKIILEKNSHNTEQNLKYSLKIMREHKFKTALVVTNKFHIYRAIKLSKDVGLKAQGFAAPMIEDRPGITLLYFTREGASFTKYYILKIVRIF